MARTAEILGKTDDMRRYAKRFENIKKAFNEAWVDENGAISYWGEMSLSAKTKTSWGRIGTDKNGASINETYYSDRDGSKSHPSQTAYALAIDFGLIDADKIAQSGIYLKNAVERCGGVLSVGFLGISHIIPALEKAGLTEEAFALLEQTKNPSWLYSVKNGATTIWERWDSYIAETGEFGNVNMNSFNHYAYGAVGEWLFGGIAGINAASPGYKKILLSPHFGGTLTYAAAWHKSPHGIIKSAWQIDGDTLTYTCTIPESTTAELRLHGVKSRELGSGTHEFKVSLKNTYGDEENV
jgi:alpha-L-rhamnosidase